MKTFHCWFSKVGQFHWLEEYHNLPVYRLLSNNRDTEITCVTVNTGDFAEDKKRAEEFLFPDSVYLGLGIFVSSAIPLKEEPMTAVTLGASLAKMRYLVAKAKLENN